MSVETQDLMAVLDDAAPGAVRPADPADRVGGVQPRWVAAPTETAAVARLLRAASAHRLAVLPRGAGTRLHWGPPPERLDLVLDTAGLAGVVEHVAGDLVVVARAGTRIGDLQEILAGAGQRLALDGAPAEATLGGLVAHAISGPSRLLFGTLRDLLIGVTFVRADGVVAQAGGKVVKNVAGYDLAKLLHGSWGTLGVITEVVLRLHPLPGGRRWVTVPAADPQRVGELAQRVVHAQLVPAALELDRTVDGAATLAVLLEGLDVAVESRAAAAAALLGERAEVTTRAPSWWGRPPYDAGGVLLRLTAQLTGLPRLLEALDEAETATGLAVHVRGSAGVGSLQAGLEPTATPPAVADLVARLRRQADEWGGTVVVLDAPPAVLAGLDPWGPVAGLDLMRRVKAHFDPERLLSPGRFVGGI